MSSKYDVVFKRLSECAAEDLSTFRVEIVSPEYDYAEAQEIDELRRVSLAIQSPEPQSLTTT